MSTVACTNELSIRHSRSIYIYIFCILIFLYAFGPVSWSSHQALIAL
jgi:hypothetical protein